MGFHLVKRKYWVLILLTAVIILLDQWTKALVLNRFHLGESIAVIPGFFNFTFVKNPGAAFGLLATADPAFRIPFFLLVPLIALGAIGYVFHKLDGDDIRMSTALSLVIGGAIGNLIDRAMLSYVVDFLDFHWKNIYHFPAFNIADSTICVGVAMLMFDMLLQEKAVRKNQGSERNASPAR